MDAETAEVSRDFSVWMKMENDNKKVKVYSTPSCPWCHKAKEFLEEHKIKFEEHDVSADQDAAKKMFEKTGQMSVPVIEVGDEAVVGFDKNKLKKVLGISG